MTEFKQGWDIVGGKRYWFRSGFEVRWARYLEFLKEIGEIADWEYEPKDFWFEEIKRGTVSYKPDFRVNYMRQLSDPNAAIGEIIWHECKGHIQQKDVTKFRRMAKYYPDEKIILVMQNIPKTSTRKNFEKRRRIANAKQYIERVMDGSEVLKKAGF